MLVIIDDDAVAGESLSDVFSELYPVRFFQSPTEALKFIETEPFFPQVCIVDYRMPEMSGAFVARRIKQLNRDLQVIMISGFVDFEDVQELLKQRDVDEFHRKPLDVQALKKSVEFRRKLFLKRSAI
ncbi:MAG: response regulator [Chloroherpetonaceae bacterium]|nr:response regulator [Chloroherpetonaceae bacterium]MDW8437521.1 response regulator [Chloroherpetonaceae bacterium]